MADKGRSNLVVNERGPDVNWFSGGQDIYANRQWYRTKNSIEEQFDLDVVGTGYAFGTTHVFEADKRGDKLLELELICKRGALSVTGGSGNTYSRFQDWEGYRNIKEIRVLYSNKIYCRLYGEKMLREMLEESPAPLRNTLAAEALGQKTNAERNALAAASNITTIVKLRVPWRKISKGLAMIALPNKLRIEVDIAPLTEICQYDGTGYSPACTLTNLKLRCHYVHLKQEDRTALFQQVMSKGIMTKISTGEYHWKENIDANLTSFPFRLRNIRNASYRIVGHIIPKSAVDSPASRDFSNNVLPARIYMTDNGTAVTDTVECNDATATFNYNLLNKRLAHPNHKTGMNTFELFFCPKQFVEKSEDDCYGSRNISKYNNPQLVMEWDAGSPSVDSYLYLTSDIHNIGIQQKGDLRVYLM